MKAIFEDTKNSNDRCEKESNELFKANKMMALIVDEQEKHIQELLDGDFAKQMAHEIELDEARCRELRGDGKSREELLSLIKEKTQKIGDIEREIREETKSVSTAQSKLRKIDEGLKTEMGKKILELRKREAAMNAFIRNYPTLKKELQNEIMKRQKDINAILFRTASHIESLNSLPTAEAYSKLKKEFRYKQDQMNESQQTLSKLRLELERHRRELDDLQNIDLRIQREQVALQAQIEAMKRETPIYADIEPMREEKEREIDELKSKRDELKEFLRNLKKTTNAIATQYNKTKAELKTNEFQKRISKSEKDFQKNTQENYVINCCIEDIRRENSYNATKIQVFSILSEINNNMEESPTGPAA